MQNIYEYLARNNDLKALECDRVKYTISKINIYGHNHLLVEFEKPEYINRIEITDDSALKTVIPESRLIYDNGFKCDIPGTYGIHVNKRYVPSIPSEEIKSFEYHEIGERYGTTDTLRFNIYGISKNITLNLDTVLLASCENIGENKYIIYGDDPNMLFQKKVNANEAKYIYIKYHTACQSEMAQIFYASQDSPKLSEAKSRMITVSPNGNFVYVLDMSDDLEWKGVINLIRFDPVSYDNLSQEGECVIEYINVNNTPPVYNSRADFIQTQGVNGWSYHTFNNGITYREMKWDKKEKLWYGINMERFFLSSETQSSFGAISTIRRWTCPASGKYVIECGFKQITSGEKNILKIKLNNEMLYKYKDSTLSGKLETELELKRGDNLNFEFCNEFWVGVEILGIDIVIKKAI